MKTKLRIENMRKKSSMKKKKGDDVKNRMQRKRQKETRKKKNPPVHKYKYGLRRFTKLQIESQRQGRIRSKS